MAEEANTKTKSKSKKVLLKDDSAKKSIRVGPEYQVEIPSTIQDSVAGGVNDDISGGSGEEIETLLWTPHLEGIDEDEIAQFLKTACSLDKTETVMASTSAAVPDNEEALSLLRQCACHNVLVRRDVEREAAEKFASLSRSTATSAYKASVYGKWTPEQIDRFEKGLSHFRKRFHLIRKWHVKEKSVAELVEFYYFWKKSTRRDAFVARKAALKKSKKGKRKRKKST